MNKKTAIILSIALVVALIAIAVIASFPTYIFEEPQRPIGNIQSDKINQSSGDTSSEKTEDKLGVDEGYLSDNEEDGVQALLPGIGDAQEGASAGTNKDDSTYVTVAKTDSATLLAQKNAFTSELKVKLKKLGILNKDYHRAKHFTESFAGKINAYKYTVTRDGKDYEPFAAAKLVIDIPKGYDAKNVGIAYLFDDYVQVLNATVNQEDGTISASINTTGVYILFEYKPEDEIEFPEDNDASSDSSNTSSNESEGNTSSGTSSDTTSSDTTSSDPDKMDMEGWSPWQ